MRYGQDPTLWGDIQHGSKLEALLVIRLDPILRRQFNALFKGTLLLCDKYGLPGILLPVVHWSLFPLPDHPEALGWLQW